MLTGNGLLRSLPARVVLIATSKMMEIGVFEELTKYLQILLEDSASYERGDAEQI